MSILINGVVLAPVGGMVTLIAAVRTGADAVYFGAKQFNARRNAENFDDGEIKKAIEYAKLNNVKSYLALNTLIKDSEINDALDLVDRVCEYGIDAVIVQDLGLANLIHKNFPKLSLHASTQLSVHSPSAISFLKEMGFSRVVPAREMSKTELSKFCKVAKESEMEVEVFVHGALCMCLSGQCYFSAYLGGRSANRGLCAGTCRLPFKTEGGTGYDLSLKDLSLINYIPELTEIGVTSFKIEGRMKRPEYVATATSAARQMVDEGIVDENILSLLEQVFARSGFTKGYYEGALGKDMFGVRSEQDKQCSADALSKIHQLYRNERQRIPLNLKFYLKENEPSKLTVEAEEIRVTVMGDIPQKAINRPLTENRVAESLSKLGGTCYYLDKKAISLDTGLMLPISALNSLRKKAVEELNQKRLSAKTTLEEPIKKIEKSEIRNFPLRKIKGFFVRFSNLKQFLECENLLQSLMGYSLPAEEILKGLGNTAISTKTKNQLKNAYAELSRGAPDDRYTASLLEQLAALGIKKAVCSNIGAVSLALKTEFEVMGGFGLNLFNSHSTEFIKEKGILKGVISTELSFKEIGELKTDGNIKLFAMCYGRQPLMLTRNCPVKNGIGCRGSLSGCKITDRKNQTFPVICRNGFSEILNCKITDVSDSLDRISVDGGYLYFTLEDPERAKEVILEFLNKKGRSGTDYTRGLYKTGVL